VDGVDDLGVVNALVDRRDGDEARRPRAVTFAQRLTSLENTAHGARRTNLANVLYVSLQGRYGVGGDADD
jgi:hypothetical protein